MTERPRSGDRQGEGGGLQTGAADAGAFALLTKGTVVGRYVVEKRIGAGAMGDVYLAVDASLGRQAALKILGSKHMNNATVRERFLREARALARLSHPNLITVFESGHTGEPDRPYFAMELLEGGDTQKLLEERGPLASGVVALIGAQAAAGLGEAAHAGIIHRDVKPANLGISGQGILKVTDFSLAKSAFLEKGLTGKGMVVGTADYIAPEQARGEEVDERADVYALGGTLFHLLTGKPPFRADKGTEVQKYIDVMRAHLTAPVPDPRRYVPGVDTEVAALITRMMAKNRKERPSFAEVATDLLRAATRLGGELPSTTRRMLTVPAGVKVLPLGDHDGGGDRGDSGDNDDQPAAASPRRSPPPRARARRSLTLTYVLMTVGFVLGGLIVALLVRR